MEKMQKSVLDWLGQMSDEWGASAVPENKPELTVIVNFIVITNYQWQNPCLIPSVKTDPRMHKKTQDSVAVFGWAGELQTHWIFASHSLNLTRAVTTTTKTANNRTRTINMSILRPPKQQSSVPWHNMMWFEARPAATESTIGQFSRSLSQSMIKTLSFTVHVQCPKPN